MLFTTIEFGGLAAELPHEHFELQGFRLGLGGAADVERFLEPCASFSRLSPLVGEHCEIPRLHRDCPRVRRLLCRVEREHELLLRIFEALGVEIDRAEIARGPRHSRSVARG